MRKKLCILLPTHWAARMGGSQYQAKLLIARLLERYDVEITYLTTRADPNYQPQGYRVVKFSDPGGLRRYGFFFDARRLFRALSQHRPEIVFQQVGCGHTGIAAFYAKRSGSKFFWRVTSDRSVQPDQQAWWRIHQRIERSFLNYGIRHADGIFAQTESQRRMLKRYFERDDAIVVRNFHPQPVTPGRRTAGTRVLWIANLKPLKNPGAFLRLAERFADRPGLEFNIVGAAMGSNPWTKTVLDGAAATSNVRYLGAKTQDEVNALIADSHLLVNTSDYEGFSNTFIQAWLRGVPVISLNVNPDGLLDGKLGLLSGTEEQMFYDVKLLLDEPEKRDTMGVYCRDYALQHHAEHNIDAVAKHMGLDPLAS